LLDFQNRIFSVIVPKGPYIDTGHVLSSLRDIDLRVLAAFIAQSRCPTWRSTHLIQNLNAEGTSRLRIQPSVTKFSNRVSLTLTSNDLDEKAMFIKDEENYVEYPPNTIYVLTGLKSGSNALPGEIGKIG
jgi:hypothetical protein